MIGLAGLAAGCSDSSDGADTSDAAAEHTIVVFAASSLTEAFTDLGAAFESAHPGVAVTFNFAGTGDLVQQLADGAPADVIATADRRSLTELADPALLAAEPVTFARNTFSMVVEHGNPRHIGTLADLANPDLIVVLCADTVPCGRGAAAVLALAGVNLTAKSYEDRVKAVVSKVASGEADAGIAYVTDALAAANDVDSVAIPDDVNVVNDYPIAVAASSSDVATSTAFVEFVQSAAGQAILAKYGFLAP